MMDEPMPSNIYSRFIALTEGDLSPETILADYGVLKELVEQGGLQFQTVRDTFRKMVANLEDSKDFLEYFPLLTDFLETMRARLMEYEAAL